MNYRLAAPGIDPSLQNLGPSIWGGSKSGPRIDALTERVDALQAKLDSHEMEDKAVLKRVSDLERQYETVEGNVKRHEQFLFHMGKRLAKNDQDDFESWTNLNEQIRIFVKQFKDLEGKIQTLEMSREHLRRSGNERAGGAGQNMTKQ
jgi:predicted  nucleic acid-binding Zn-ribbon protein